jgi:DNA-binding NarL/FixJ family response regulator
MIRVLIADDHALLRASLRRLLDATPDMRVVAEVGSGDEILPALARGHVDVVVLDVSMPGGGFLQILGDLRHQHPDVRAIILSGHAEDEFAERAFAAGAAGYVAKVRTPEDLVVAVRRAVQGLSFASEGLAPRLQPQEPPGNPGLPTDLSRDPL